VFISNKYNDIFVTILKKVEKDSDRDYWMTAAEAKEYGMIDSILTRAKK